MNAAIHPRLGSSPLPPLMMPCATMRSGPKARVISTSWCRQSGPGIPPPPFSIGRWNQALFRSMHKDFDWPQPNHCCARNARTECSGPETLDACWMRKQNHRFLGCPAPCCGSWVVRFPKCTVLGFSVLPESSVPDRAVAARCTIMRSHG